MDALDPNDGIEFSAALYNSSSFELSLRNALTDNGILVAQLGMLCTIHIPFFSQGQIDNSNFFRKNVGRSPTHKDPVDEVGEFSARADMVVTLKNLGFESFHVYDEVRNLF